MCDKAPSDDTFKRKIVSSSYHILFSTSVATLVFVNNFLFIPNRAFAQWHLQHCQQTQNYHGSFKRKCTVTIFLKLLLFVKSRHSFERPCIIETTQTQSSQPDTLNSKHTNSVRSMHCNVLHSISSLLCRYVWWNDFWRGMVMMSQCQGKAWVLQVIVMCGEGWRRRSSCI